MRTSAALPVPGLPRALGLLVAPRSQGGQPQRKRRDDREAARAGADPHQRVGVVVLLVEPVTPPVEPEPEPLPPDVEPEPLLPIELVPPLLLPPLLVASLPLLPVVPLLPVLPPAVLPEPPEPEPMPLPDGLVVLEEPVEPVAPVEPVVPSRLLQALSESAATTASVAAAH